MCPPTSDHPVPPLGDDQPLKGLKVVELATVLAGPLVGTFLAELGADVLKIEPPGRGDVTRSWRLAGESQEGPGAYYAAANGHKRIERMNLKTDEGQRALGQHLDDADILIQNARPTSLAGLGLDPDTLAARHPRLIHVHLLGFLDNPARGGYDIVVQAESGFLSMNGEPDGAPFRMPVALMDVLAAHQMRSGLLLALYERERTGRGAYIETWLDASGFSGLVNRGTEHLVAGRTPEPLGALHPQIAPYGELFTCRCGSVVVTAVGNNPQFRSLCSVLGQEELADDARFATNPERVTHRTALARLLAPLFADIEAGPLLDEALSRGIPLGRVKSVSDALSSGTGRAMTAAYDVEGTPVRHVRQVAFRIHRNGNRTT